MEPKKRKTYERDGKKYYINEKGIEEEDWTESELNKPLNLPIQSVEVSQDMSKIDKLEKDSFQILDKSCRARFRSLDAYQNPIHQADPLNKHSAAPEIYCLALNNEPDSYCAGYSNGEIHMVTKRKNLKVAQHSRDTILSMRFSPKFSYMLISVSSVGDVVHTHVPTGKKLTEFKIQGEDKFVRCMDITKNGEKLAIGFDNGEINIYDDSTQTLEESIKSGTSFTTGHINQIHSLAFDREKPYMLVSGGRDKRVIIWDTRFREAEQMVVEPYILGDSIDIKGYNILAGSYEAKQGVLLYDIRNFKDPVKTFRTDSQIYCCKFSKYEKSNLFAAGGYKRNVIKVFDINKDKCICGIDGINSACYALDFSTTGAVLGYGCKDGGVRIIDI